MIKAESITKRYSGHTALEDVSIEIPEQSIYGLLGPNGAGKTTLIRIINQIIEPDSGSIYIQGEKLKSDHISIIGYLPEERGLYKDMTVGEHLLYLGQLRGLTKRDSIAKIKDWTSRLGISEWLKVKIEDLSKGMAQKIQFIATVINQPKLLILDEPFSGFDPVNANIIKDEILRLKQEGTTVLFSTHRMESVEELCDHLTLINKSKVILSGSLREVKNKFKDGTYQLTIQGDIRVNPEIFTINSEQKTSDNTSKLIVQLADQANTKMLLSHILETAEIISFNEKEPSINEIFISLTTGHE